MRGNISVLPLARVVLTIEARTTYPFQFWKTKIEMLSELETANPSIEKIRAKKNIMTNKIATENNSVGVIYKSHAEAEEAVKVLQHAGFEMKNLSIIARDFHTDEHVVGYYNSGDRMMYWGKEGAFWGGFWGLLFGSAFFWVPGVGPLLIAGPLVTWIIAALEGAAVVGGLSAIGAGLYGIGIPKDTVLEYETAITAGKFVLIIHDSPEQVRRAKEVLKDSGSEKIHDLSINVRRDFPSFGRKNGIENGNKSRPETGLGDGRM